MLLSRTVTHCSVRQTKELISSDEFTVWQAEYALSPWGDETQILGSIPRLYYNRYRPKMAQPAGERDFIPMRLGRGVWERMQPRQTQSPKQIFAVLQTLTDAMKKANRGRK